MPKKSVSTSFDALSTVGATVIKRLNPGAPGTRRWQERYGDSLVCVRYRQDPTKGRRYTTVEIIVDERSCREPAGLIRIALGESQLRRQVCELGAEWIADRQLWRVPITTICALGLENRIVEKCQ